MNNCRKSFFLNLIKIAARREDIEALRGILEFKYPGDRRIPGFAVQYYEKFVKGKNLPTPLTEDSLPQPLPETAEELLTLLQSAEVVKRKTKKEEYAENILLKHPSVDLTNLNEDYLSWLNQRYIENKTKSGEIVHPIEEALVTLRKFPSVQDKYKTSAEFKEKVEKAGYNEKAGYADISSIQNLTLDDMEKIISLDTSGLTVRVEGVEIKEEEFLGKFGEWNLWLPHTKETSAKIAGYDEDYEPKTTWCTGRTRGSNAFYNYIGRGDIPAFLFYIIKDNPSDDEDWLSLGYISQGNRLVPDFTGTNGGLSVNRVNKGLREEDYSRILGDSWNSIKSRIETELERHKIVEGGEEKYVSPARSLIEAMAKNVEEFKKELKPKSNEEKKDFIEVIIDSDPSDDVLKVCGNTLARIDHKYFLEKFSEEPWAEPYLGLAAKNLAENSPKYFLEYFSHKPWAKPYLGLAAKNFAEKDPKYFLEYFSENILTKDYLDLAAENLAKIDPQMFIEKYSGEPWVKPHHIELAEKEYMKEFPFDFLLRFLDKSWVNPDHIDSAAKNCAESEPKLFLYYFSHKPWAKPYLGLAAKNFAEKDPKYFLQHFSERPWYLNRLLEKQPSERISAKYYLNLAADNLAKIDPDQLLRLLEEPWVKLWIKPHHIRLAVKKVANQKPGIFLQEFSHKPWAKPDLIDSAAKNLAENNPEYFLEYFSHKPWAQPYIDLAVRSFIEKDPKNFLSYFSDEPWAKDYLDLAAKNCAEKEPSYFLTNFSNKPWAQPYIELARSKLKAKQASNSIQKKLLKLSSFLKSNNLKEYNEISIIIKLCKI
jgi:hypothetical protein